MILVLLGTSPYPFNRLLIAVDEWSRHSRERVVVQSGSTPTEEVSLECHPFVDHSVILNWLEECELVICQGGFGSIGDSLRARRPTIVVPRRPELNEARHCQDELVAALAAKGLIIRLDDVKDLSHAIEKARNATFELQSTGLIPEIVFRKVKEAFA